ncbi:Methionine--tRNA ligase [Limihaloglobus sulfuriphilus]|uniref:Methionine--tRNA ligase n=1 Tax=Limihaloglobus sulfuriphilus TaxID=1851148 RepID=A0A1Q2MCV5_9BACT|nr:methionine--tRNA ligase [Limihaloglobus sulfuriphilus]AQQ70082.1 Methionine--tRNA ligase [Limihaloglobus sulfuriphilus]
MTRKILVTSALPYANGPIHIGHMVEYIQTDIWVRFQKMMGNECFYFCADDTHGTPVMISAAKQGITPEDMIAKVQDEHKKDFAAFEIEFDNYYTTHSQENHELSVEIYNHMKEDGAIATKTIEQAYCEKCSMFLPDRFIRGVCPKCGADNQYGDSCDNCGAAYSSTELKDPHCSVCGETPTRKKSLHYFCTLNKYQDRLQKHLNEYASKPVASKLQEWMAEGLRNWDISRDGPYFGFKIPGEDNKYFYVWMDAPIGYLASIKNFFDGRCKNFREEWNNSEIYHFIGKDIITFHGLFWPAMLMSSGFKLPQKLCVHGFLTVNGQKMSKSKGTFIKASTYLKHLNPEHLRYYYAAKLSDGLDDIDLNYQDFANRVNSELVGKLANLASRSAPMLKKKLGGIIGKSDERGSELIAALLNMKDQIALEYENRRFSAAVRLINRLADDVNKYIDDLQPWVTVKTDTETTRRTLSTVLNAVRIIAGYLKPVIPGFAAKVEEFLNIEPLSFSNLENILSDHEINDFKHLTKRIDMENIEAMTEESKSENLPEKEITLDEPIADECTIDEFMKVDLRVARIADAKHVEGADKLLQITLDIGGIEKNVFAGISKAYKPEDIVGRLVVCVANLKPRKMRFGVSEGMILASGPGGENVFMLSPDKGAVPGQRVH